MAAPVRDDPPWLRGSNTSPTPPSKLTVYVGPDIVFDLANLRARGVDVNVSAVCQSALRSTIEQAKTYRATTRSKRKV